MWSPENRTAFVHQILTLPAEQVEAAIERVLLVVAAESIAA